MHAVKLCHPSLVARLLTAAVVLLCLSRSGSAYPSDWIKRDPLVPVLGFLG